MKKLVITLIIAITAVLSATADERDTLWFRIAGAGVQDLDFTPDDKYVIAWTNAIEFWEVQQGVKEYSIPIDVKAAGDYNYNKQYLVFAKDSTPKLLNWQTKEVVEGFEKADFKINRIRTAKSKNEFMAGKGDAPQTIYFWDINQKKIIDSFNILTQFEKNGFTWSRALIDYDYCGNNDEYFYAKYSDYNNYIVTVPPPERQTNYFYHIYDRNTKKLIDSIYVNTTIKYATIIVNKAQVMNDRSKIAFNIKGGIINFYDVYSKEFYDKIVFDDRDFVQAGDIEFNKNSTIIGLTQGSGCCRYLKIFSLNTKEKLLQYNVGSWGHISFSNDNKFLITSISSILSLYPNQWLGTNVSLTTDSNLIITPNPVSNSIRISYDFAFPTNYELSIYDLTGNKISIIDQGFADKLQYKIDYDVSNLSSGAYFIKLIYGNQTISKKFIKE